jgi:hypothetical protein
MWPQLLWLLRVVWFLQTGICCFSPPKAHILTSQTYPGEQQCLSNMSRTGADNVPVSKELRLEPGRGVVHCRLVISRPPPLEGGWLQGQGEVGEAEVSHPRSIPFLRHCADRFSCARKWRVTCAKVQGENPCDESYCQTGSDDDDD